MDKNQASQIVKLEIEESAGYYSAFMDNMRISKSKPVGVSKTVLTIHCPKTYILEAINHHSGVHTLTTDELVQRDSKIKSFSMKKTAKKFYKMAKERAIDLGSDGHSYKMVFMEDIDDIFKELIGEKNEKRN